MLEPDKVSAKLRLKELRRSASGLLGTRNTMKEYGRAASPHVKHRSANALDVQGSLMSAYSRTAVMPT